MSGIELITIKTLSICASHCHKYTMRERFVALNLTGGRSFVNVQTILHLASPKGNMVDRKESCLGFLISNCYNEVDRKKVFGH